MPKDDALASYRAKRDFGKTKEPRAEAAFAPDEYPRFVVQKHAATRLHYDLRLEVDGVFKSWAVTRGPSPDPHDKRLAVEVEDHPLAYGDFEGTIPKDQYGGGTVMLWDRGYWMPEDSTDPAEALRKGELKFVLAGEKMKGSWVLVRMRRDRDGGKRTNWLLIKHRDEFARDSDRWGEDDVSVASGRSMDEIAAGRGRKPKPFIARGAAPLKADAIWSTRESEADTAKAWQHPKRTPATLAAIPGFIAPQLCKTSAHPPTGPGWVHEIKLDGYRIQLRVEHGRATLYTRRGEIWTDRFPELAREAKRLPDCSIDGEVVALNRDGVPDFSALQAALSEGKTRGLIYFAFDLLVDGREDLRALPLLERKERLRALHESKLGNSSRVRFLDHVEGPGDAVFESACRMHLEGIVSKKADAAYRSSRSAAWLKAKCRAGHEVVIGGWSGGPHKVRSLIAGVYRGDHLVHVGRVGTGFNARNTKELVRRLNGHATGRSPFAGATAPRKEADWTWVEPKLVCEIEFAGWTDAGMARQAAYKGLREDKPAREVRAERPVPSSRAHLAQPAEANVMRSGASEASVMGIAISKPDKELWPAAGNAPAVTKLDIARYLQEVGPWMIAHIEGRPCSLVRAPDGVGAETWFQRHAFPGVPESVQQVKVENERQPYLQIDRVESLVELAGLAAVEFHPWNNAPNALQVPGRLVFDLDPGEGVEFAAVVEAAKELRERLEQVGLAAFCKTTGGKGLHVVTPLKPTRGDGIGWDEAKEFAQAICTLMAADNPDRYLVNMSKKQRSGRIYLDYLRNDRMATAVAVLSPRAREGATVSMPLNWSQVRSGLDPKRFTVHTAARLLGQVTDWESYAKASRPLAAAVRRISAKGRRSK